jgi:hypothetical protein
MHFWTRTETNLARSDLQQPISRARGIRLAIDPDRDFRRRQLLDAPPLSDATARNSIDFPIAQVGALVRRSRSHARNPSVVYRRRFPEAREHWRSPRTRLASRVHESCNSDPIGSTSLLARDQARAEATWARLLASVAMRRFGSVESVTPPGDTM